MNRRNVLGGLVGTAASSLAQTGRAAPPAKTGSKPRNVIFILTDDHRYDAMGFLKGQEWLETPQHGPHGSRRLPLSRTRS